MKSRTQAGILAILLGGLGIHRFYLGQTGKGIANVLLCWSFIPMILGVVTGIMWLLGSDENFDKKYNSQAIQRSILDAIVNQKEGK